MTLSAVQPDPVPPVTVDLRPLPRPQRHMLVFRQFEALMPGESFELINDHNPLGLLHQFEHYLPGQFTWTYRVEGPADWHVIVGRPHEGEVAQVDHSHSDSCGCGSSGRGGCG